MNPDSLRVHASENLVDTYLRLGLAVPAASVVERDAFVCCSGPIDHPICNFAARLRLDPWSARDLRDLASSRIAFNVYTMPGDEPEHLPEILARAGFQKTYELVQMICANPDPGAPLEMRPAKDQNERLAVAKFMCEQFFARHNDPLRRQIAHATAKAEGLELYDLPERGQPIGGIMLGYGGGLLGVYNLCVASSRRGRGNGRAILDWALTLARESGKAATLQCDSLLEDWYRYRGFVSSGKVGVYSLPKRKDDDIIL